MGIDHSLVIAQHAHRGLRWQLLGFAVWLGLAVVSMIGARDNPLPAMLVALSGVGVVFIGRGLRATGALLRAVKSPQPGWIAWIVPVTFVVGPAVFALGMLLLLRVVRAAP